MDGTLWDAVDSYVKVWDATFAEIGSGAAVDREQLIRCMGQPIDVIYSRLVGDPSGAADFLKRLDDNEATMMRTLGGVLYPGVREYIPRLARHFRLFMVSNCGAAGLPNFLEYTGLTPYFTATLSHGQTGLPKDGNIRLLTEQYSLTAPIYIGDTAGDCASAHAAGIPMMFAAYGFGTAPEADFSAKSFGDVARFFLDQIQ